MTFKNQYVRATTWADLDKCCKDNLSKEKAQEMVDAMDIVNDTTGLDMRQEFLLGNLKSMLKHNLI